MVKFQMRYMVGWICKERSIECHKCAHSLLTGSQSYGRQPYDQAKKEWYDLEATRCHHIGLVPICNSLQVACHMFSSLPVLFAGLLSWFLIAAILEILLVLSLCILQEQCYIYNWRTRCKNDRVYSPTGSNTCCCQQQEKCICNATMSEVYWKSESRCGGHPTT